MQIFGIDFTSSPRKAKQIFCCVGSLKEGRLTIDSIESWTSFHPFEAFLESPGPWFAGLDSPLGQPTELIRDFGWPLQWSDYVSRVARLTKEEFVAKLETYSKAKPSGKKHLFRRTDREASACSPMMIYGVPVAKMFYEAAPRLLRSTVSILPCRLTNTDRTLVETYPALVARQLVGRTSYKTSSPSSDTTAKRTLRREMLKKLCGSATGICEIQVSLSNALAKSCEEDHSGDRLDSVFCCLQSAWASGHIGTLVPPGVDRNEGWIVPSFDHG